MDPTTGALIGVAIANLLTLFTLLIKDRSAAAKEIRHRQWEKEDRAALATQVVATSATLAAKVQADGIALAAQVELQAVASRAARDVIISLLRESHSEIVANTKISTDAFHEANGAKLMLAEEVRRRNEIQTAVEQAAGKPPDEKLGRR